MTLPSDNSNSPPKPAKATRIDAFLLIVIGAGAMLVPLLRFNNGFAMISFIVGLCAVIAGVLTLIKRGGVA